jgi:hypothetical protein
MQITTDNSARNRIDAACTKYLYGSVSQTGQPKREALAWPVAIAHGAGIKLKDNWNWGVRANGYAAAKTNEKLIAPDVDVTLCPADKVRIASPHYPREDGLVGTGDPRKPQSGGAGSGIAYWGYLSYAINEDVCGADLKPSQTGDGGGPGCWKGNPNPNDAPFKGETGNMNAGPRLEGQLDKIFDPASVMLMIDAGRDDDTQQIGGTGGFANLIISAKSDGPDLPFFHRNWQQRLPEKRHPKGQLGVTYADGHGATIRPTGHVTVGGRLNIKIPKGYSGPTRISPYKPLNVPNLN